MSKLVPNSFPHPNILVDQLSYYLTPAEEKVLNKAVREILGWHNKVESRKAAIALSILFAQKDRSTASAFHQLTYPYVSPHDILETL